MLGRRPLRLVVQIYEIEVDIANGTAKKPDICSNYNVQSEGYLILCKL